MFPCPLNILVRLVFKFSYRIGRKCGRSEVDGGKGSSYGQKNEVLVLLLKEMAVTVQLGR